MSLFTELARRPENLGWHLAGMLVLASYNRGTAQGGLDAPMHWIVTLVAAFLVGAVVALISYRKTRNKPQALWHFTLVAWVLVVLQVVGSYQ